MNTNGQPVLEAHDLTKTFRTRKEKIEAVRGIDMEIWPGEIFGFLGPNGAGKTTTLRMLSTLLPIESGRAVVSGFDVHKSPHQVRQRIGYVSQLGGSDRLATGREDLLLQGELYGMGRREAERRADELIEVLDLAEFASRRVQSYSGGQRRRLDIALGIMHRPDVLFLDEPTTGLDPQNRANLWVQISKLREAGTTIFLTTHYLEEADALSNRLAIMDHGQLVAEGTSRQLKQQIAADSVVVSLQDDGAGPEGAMRLLQEQDFVREVSAESDHLRLYVDDGVTALPRILRLLDQNGMTIKTVTLSEPTLDDVFLRYTGRSLRDAGQPPGGKDPQ
ncbi:MAG: ATP-binding cassette domain-containing protein [Actinobacteria bacterium]|nr:ATP-binding cassette domain-containing protein [Actinomycetota bacterium]